MESQELGPWIQNSSLSLWQVDRVCGRQSTLTEDRLKNEKGPTTQEKSSCGGDSSHSLFLLVI
jgi:hypothetical protein